MAQSLHGLIYDIVDIPEHFEIGKLKDFCKRLVREIESVQSIKSPASSEKDFDDLEESQEKQILKDEFNEANEDESNDDDGSQLYDQKIKSQPTFIFHLDTASNNELTSSTLKLFDDIFQNVPYEIKSSNSQDRNQEEVKNIEPKKSRNKLTRRRIRKSFIHD